MPMKEEEFISVYGKDIGGTVLSILSLYLIEMPFNAFANRADPDQAAHVRAA